MFFRFWHKLNKLPQKVPSLTRTRSLADKVLLNGDFCKNQDARRPLYRQVFYVIDKNFDAVLSLDEMDEFGHFMLGHRWSRETAEDFIEKFDTNHNGSVDFNE